jgi:hypothetical protein
MPLLLILLFLFFPSFLNAQIPMRIKLMEFSKDPVTIAVYEGGRIWIDSKDRNKFYYDNGKELVIYDLKNNQVKEVSKTDFEKVAKDLENVAANKILKSHWSFTFDEIVSCYTVDKTSQNLIVADNAGFLYFFDIKKKEFKGRLKLSNKAIKIIKPLQNGSLLLINEGGSIIYVEYVRIPFFSFLQDLRSSYRVYKETNLNYNFVSRVFLNEKEDLVGIVVNHKEIYLFKLPRLEKVKSISEDGFIRYADFIDENKLFYATTTVFIKYENPSSIESHLAIIAHFFDRSGITIPSLSGNLIMRFENRKELRIYNVNPLSLLVDFGSLFEKNLEINISPDDKTIIIYSNDKNRFGIYYLK